MRFCLFAMRLHLPGKPVLLLSIVTLAVPAALSLLTSCEFSWGSKKALWPDLSPITLDSKVQTILTLLGEPPSPHAIETDGENLAAAGRELFHAGRASHPETGLPGRRLSEYFYCTDCHNTHREVPDPARLGDPASRLAFIDGRDLDLPPGPSLAGAVNRSTWFTGDRFAERVATPEEIGRARSSLREAIRLCAQAGASGRQPELWEIEALLAFLWTREWTLADLGVTSIELATWKRRALEPAETESVAGEIRARFAHATPSTSGDPGPLAESHNSDPENGRRVWTRSCQHCHGAEGTSESYFGEEEGTWEELASRFHSTGDRSIYSLIRDGTGPGEDKKAFMARYPVERLSDSQIEDLRAFVEQRADGG